MTLSRIAGMPSCKPARASLRRHAGRRACHASPALWRVCRTRLFTRGWRVLAPSPLLSLTRLNPTDRVVRDTGGLPEILGRLGDLEVRLARTTKDIRRCQRLRFKVFYDEMGAKADARGFLSRRDIDPYDRLCDHIMVIDNKARSTVSGRSGRR